jgi:hypothetical protein
MHQTNTLMAGVTAAVLLGSPGPSVSAAGAPDGRGAETQLAQAPTAPAVEEAEDAVALLLDRTPAEQAKSLDELLSKMPGTSREVAKQAIDNLLLEDKIHQVGAGTTADPYRYWSLKTHQT